ncbi:MAG: PaaI family thioesterase [Alphaproteobacteria bacterium]
MPANKGSPTVHNPDFEAEGRVAFASQSLMTTLGATLTGIAPGEVEISLPVAPHILQQHGFVHAGALTSIVDTACGFAAFTLMPKGAGVLTVEFKMNLMSPGVGERIIAVGRVVKPGRTLMVTLGEVFAETKGQRKLIAMMTATMMVMDDTKTQASPGLGGKA